MEKMRKKKLFASRQDAMDSLALQVLTANKQFKTDPDDESGALVRIGTTIGLFTKTYGVILPKAVRIPIISFQAMKAELQNPRNEEIDYVRFLIETYSLLSPEEQQEPDKIRHFNNLLLVAEQLEVIPMEKPKHSDITMTGIARINEFLEDKGNAVRMTEFIIALSASDREDIECYIEGLDLETRILIRSTIRKMVDESPLRGTTEEQQRIILQNGWLASFVKWTSALVAIPLNFVMAVWDWIRFMKKEYQHAEGAFGVGMFVLKNVSGFEIGRNFWNRSLSGLLASDYVSSPEHQAKAGKKYLNPLDFVKVGTIMSNAVHKY